MNKVISNLNFNDFGSKALMKKKLKIYLEEKELFNFKVSNYPMLISLSLVMFLEELFTDCITYIEKNDKNGLYVIESKYLVMVFEKYDFIQKYLKKYNSQIKYDGNLLFNVNKVYKNLEYKVGDKIMVDNETKNILNYLLVCIQYDLINLSIVIITYSGKKTFNKQLFLSSLNYFFVDNDFIKKVNLKLDCYEAEMKQSNDEETEVEPETNENVDENVDEKNDENVE